LDFPGPCGVWDGGAIYSLDQAERQGFAGDPRFRLSGDPWELSERLYERYQRSYRLARGEKYLELLSVDLDDENQILEYVSTWGPLDVRALDAPRMQRQWFGVYVEEASPFRALRYYPGFGTDLVHTARDGSLLATAAALSDSQRKAGPVWVISDTVEEFRWAAKAIRDLYRAWVCLSEGTDPGEVTWDNPVMSAATDPKWLLYDVREFFEPTMAELLEAFSPRVWLVDADTHRATPHRRVRISPEPRDVTLFEVLALELFRHIVEEASYKLCANPLCRRTFVRQDGNAQHRQSRMHGVLYCSRRCANAVAQRKLRQRRRADTTT